MKDQVHLHPTMCYVSHLHRIIAPNCLEPSKLQWHVNPAPDNLNCIYARSKICNTVHGSSPVFFALMDTQNCNPSMSSNQLYCMPACRHSRTPSFVSTSLSSFRLMGNNAQAWSAYQKRSLSSMLVHIWFPGPFANLVRLSSSACFHIHMHTCAPSLWPWCLKLLLIEDRVMTSVCFLLSSASGYYMKYSFALCCVHIDHIDCGFAFQFM